MKLRILSAAAAMVVCLSSCSITMPVAATSNPVGSKMGEASAPVFLRVFCFGGDASIKSAAKNGGITKISTVDMKMTDILGIIQTYTTMVSGE